MLNPIKLSVIIVGYKNDKIVIDCISSIYRHNDIGQTLEVILVDNSPKHNVYEAVIENFENVIGIKNANTGFGAGNNLGEATASGEYLLFLNPDTILIEPIFLYAIKQFENNSKLGMFGLKLISEERKRNMSFFLLRSGGLMRSVIIKMCNAMDIYIDRIMYVSGANMFIRHCDFINCGRFDENIFMYYEEPDITRRLHTLGRATAYYKAKKIIHLEGGASTDSEMALRRRIESAIYYNRKYSINPAKQLAAELRLNYIKLGLSRVFRFGNANQTRLNISVLLENIKRINV